MQAVRIVVKLYDLPAEDGTITAFDAYGPNLYVGTDKGCVMKFVMEDTTASQPPHIVSNDSNVAGLADSTAGRAPASIFTTHVGTVNISEQPKKKIAKVQHSRTHAFLFVLCAKRLLLVDSSKMVVLMCICEGIGSFHVSSLSRTETSKAGVRSAGTTEPVDSNILASPTSPPPTAELVQGSKPVIVHVISAAEKHGHGVGVHELVTTTNGEPFATQVQELVLPEPVSAILEYNGMMCVGLRREYSMLSLKDGDARSILALNHRAPLMCLGDGEVFLKLQQNVFAVSMKTLPSASGQSVRRTMRFEHEPQCVLFRHPFLFAFSEHFCDVFSMYDDEVVERLPLAGVLFGSKFGQGDTIYAASASKLWMLRIHSLRSQLAGLIQRYKVTDAFHLLSYQRRSAPQFAVIERELNVMAGFSYLYHGRASDAMHHFGGLIDIREILRHLPGLCPEALRQRLQPDDAATPKSSEDTAARAATLQRLHNALLSAGEQDPSLQRFHETESDEASYLEGWWSCSAHNRIGIRGAENLSPTASPLLGRRKSIKPVVGCTIDDIWTQSFLKELPEAESPPVAPSPAVKRQSSSIESPLAAAEPLRVTDFGVLTCAEFLRRCRLELKRELGCYAMSTLSTSSHHQRRAAEYALLVLCLQSCHWTGAFHLVDVGRSLSLCEAYYLLHDATEFRLLCRLLWRRGLASEATALYEATLSVNRMLPPLVVPHGDAEMHFPSDFEKRHRALFESFDELLARPQREALQQPQPLSAAAVAGVLPMCGAWCMALSEIFIAVDHLDVAHLDAVLKENPAALYYLDIDGNNLLMLTVAYAHSMPSRSNYEPVFSMIAALIDAGCEVIHQNKSGDDIFAFVKRVKSASLYGTLMSFLSASCTIRLQSLKYEEEVADSDIALLRGWDPTLWKAHGSWGGYVVNRAQLQL